jgi:hypothetical protein
MMDQAEAARSPFKSMRKRPPGPGMQRAGMQSSMRSLTSLKGPTGQQSMRSLNSLKGPGKQSMRSLKSLDRPNKSPDSRNRSKSPDSSGQSNASLGLLQNISEDENDNENENVNENETSPTEMNDVIEVDQSHSLKRSMKERTGSLGRRFNFSKMMSFRSTTSLHDAAPPPPSSDDDEDFDEEEDQFESLGPASPTVMRRNRSKSPGRRNVPGTNTPRRMLKGQRSERPGIMAKSVGFDENGNAKSVPMERQSLVMSEESSEPRVTKLHQLGAEPNTSVEELRKALTDDPGSASIVDHDGKLPLHIISENEGLTEHLGDQLDKFILDELIPRNRRALVAQSNDGHFPFVQAILEWVDLVNEIPQRRMSEMGMSMEYAKNEDATEQLIPWNVVIDDIAVWGIKMLSIMIEREPLKAMWVLKIVEVIASIPCFLKNILLIDDDNTRREMMETRLINEVILHENSVGPWLVYMIVSDDEIAQTRALVYLKLVTHIEQALSHETGQSTRTRISTAFGTSNHKILERKQKVYLKAAALPAIIPALMQFKKDDFTEASSSSIVQFILDQALFQPETVLVILMDIFFLFAAVILYTLSSNKVFALISQVKFAPTLQFYPNQTAYDLCANGTFTDDFACRYYDEEFNTIEGGSVTFVSSSIDCGINCQVCRDPSAFEGSILQYNPTSFPTDFGASPLITCYDGNVEQVIDTFLIASIMFMTLNALYFIVRQLCTWLTVPHRYLRSQFGFLRVLLEVVSVVFPVILLAVFLSVVYDLPTMEGGYMSPEFHAAWLQNAPVYAACSAVAVGLLYLKILFYFKVLNQYTATFIFALGEVRLILGCFVLCYHLAFYVLTGAYMLLFFHRSSKTFSGSFGSWW